jgi:hypothetical protein
MLWRDRQPVEAAAPAVPRGDQRTAMTTSSSAISSAWGSSASSRSSPSGESVVLGKLPAAIHRSSTAAMSCTQALRIDHSDTAGTIISSGGPYAGRRGENSLDCFDGASLCGRVPESLAFAVVNDHPFRTAWHTRDLDTWIEALSPEIVLHSPVVRTPFRGPPAARELYGVLFDTFGEVEITGELADTDSHAFFWRANVAGRVIEGADRLRYDEQGKIAEISVLIRPLVNIAAFAAAIGPPLAARRSPIRGALARLLMLPLKGILTVADTVASHLIGLD